MGYLDRLFALLTGTAHRQRAPVHPSLSSHAVIPLAWLKIEKFHPFSENSSSDKCQTNSFCKCSWVICGPTGFCSEKVFTEVIVQTMIHPLSVFETCQNECYNSGSPWQLGIKADRCSLFNHMNTFIDKSWRHPTLIRAFRMSWVFFCTGYSKSSWKTILEKQEFSFFCFLCCCCDFDKWN